jgi:outer membrane protein assembly factor BamD (BamD/ComL family)
LAYLDFTERFPDSNYLEEAQNKQAHLDDVAFNQIKMAESSAVLSLEQKVAKCLEYFENYPGATNNTYVKRIKDKLQIQQIKNKHL